MLNSSVKLVLKLKNETNSLEINPFFIPNYTDLFSIFHSFSNKIYTFTLDF